MCHVRSDNITWIEVHHGILFDRRLRPHGRLCGRLCRTRAFCVQRLYGPQCYLSSNKNDGPCGYLNCISNVSCKGSVCVEFLTSFYGRFFFEEEQFIKYTPSTSSLHLGSHIFHLSTPPRFGALILPEVYQFTGNCFRMVRIVLKTTVLKLRYPKGVTGRLPLCPIKALVNSYFKFQTIIYFL